MLRWISRAYRNSVWAFIGTILSLAGLSSAINPEKFSPTVVLDHVSTILVVIYGLMMFAGAGLAAVSVVFSNKTYERAGWYLVLPSIGLVCMILVLTGTWQRLPIDIYVLGFGLVISSRIVALKEEIRDLRYAEEALAKLRARQQ